MPEAATRPNLTRAWTSEDPLIEVRGLKTGFPITSGILQRTVAHVRAVDGVDLAIRQGETLGLVGESGCGKSTLGRSILRLVEPTEGSVRFKGQEMTGLSGVVSRRIRREMAMICHAPSASLAPRQTVGEIVGEPLGIHGLYQHRGERG